MTKKKKKEKEKEKEKGTFCARLVWGLKSSLFWCSIRTES